MFYKEKKERGELCCAVFDDKGVSKRARFSTDTEDQEQERRKMFCGYGNRIAQQRMQRKRYVAGGGEGSTLPSRYRLSLPWRVD